MIDCGICHGYDRDCPNCEGRVYFHWNSKEPKRRTTLWHWFLIVGVIAIVGCCAVLALRVRYQ